jgi:hypothetical protein
MENIRLGIILIIYENSYKNNQCSIFFVLNLESATQWILPEIYIFKCRKICRAGLFKVLIIIIYVAKYTHPRDENDFRDISGVPCLLLCVDFVPCTYTTNRSRGMIQGAVSAHHMVTLALTFTVIAVQMFSGCRDSCSPFHPKLTCWISCCSEDHVT